MEFLIHPVGAMFLLMISLWAFAFSASFSNEKQEQMQHPKTGGRDTEKHRAA